MLLNVLSTFAQLPQVYLKPKQSLALGELSKSATLFVVIENEKKTDDAALVNAVKSQWNAGRVKYISLLEFTEKYKSNTLDNANLYLFDNIDQVYTPEKRIIPLTVYNGFYLTNSPRELVNSAKPTKAPPYLFFSANTLKDKKGTPNNGFYALMVKNFNYDIKYCRNEQNFKTKKKLKRKNGIYFFKADSIRDKTVLLVKEQTVREEKNAKPNVKKINNKSKKHSEKATDKYTDSKQPVIVFPEDIEYAVKHNDNNIMLYNGGCLYSAADGSVYATMRGKSSSSFRPIFSIASLAISIASVVFVATQLN